MRHLITLKKKKILIKQKLKLNLTPDQTNSHLTWPLQTQNDQSPLTVMHSAVN